MKLSKVLFAGFLMLALSTPTASVFAGDNWSKFPSTGIEAPNQTTVAPKQTTPSVRRWYRQNAKTKNQSPSTSMRCCTDLTDIFFCKKCIGGKVTVFEEEVPRAGKLTGMKAGELKKSTPAITGFKPAPLAPKEFLIIK